MITISTLTNADRIEAWPNEEQNAFSFCVWFVNREIADRTAGLLRELGYDVSDVNQSNAAVIADLRIYSVGRKQGAIEAKEFQLRLEETESIYLQHDDGHQTLHFDLH